MTHPPARAAAHRYVEFVDANRFDQVGSLFADEAVVLLPTGETIRGKELITRTWAEQFSQVGIASVTIATSVCEGSTCVIEISPQLAGDSGPRIGTVVDHFTVDDEGMITRLAIYSRPVPTD